MDIKELDLLPACEWTDEKFGAGMGNPMAVYRFVKRLADILCSAVSLLLLSPLFLIITHKAPLPGPGNLPARAGRTQCRPHLHL